MVKQSVGDVMKRCKWKRRATADQWAVEETARVWRDFWKRLRDCFPHDDDKIATFPVTVTKKDILTLQDEAWLNDTIIACCTGLVCISSKWDLIDVLGTCSHACSSRLQINTSIVAGWGPLPAQRAIKGLACTGAATELGYFV